MSAGGKGEEQGSGEPETPSRFTLRGDMKRFCDTESPGVFLFRVGGRNLVVGSRTTGVFIWYDGEVDSPV